MRLGCVGLALLALSVGGCGKAITTDIPNDQSTTRFAQWMSDHLVQPQDPEIVALAKQVTVGSASATEKLTLIHDWVITNISYDWDAYHLDEHDPTATEIIAGYDSSTAINVLHARKGVCSGYAVLTASLLVASGIPAKLVEGTTYSSSRSCDHMWNKAFVDGNWIILDTTWDSSDLLNGQSKGKNYFNPDPDFFKLSHTECSESSGQ